MSYEGVNLIDVVWTVDNNGNALLSIRFVMMRGFQNPRCNNAIQSNTRMQEIIIRKSGDEEEWSVSQSNIFLW